MILYASLLLVVILVLLVLYMSPHAIGLFVFIEFFLPSEIYLTSVFSLNINRVAYFVVLLFVIRRIWKEKIKAHPLPILFLTFLFIVTTFESYANLVSDVIQVGNPFYYFATCIVPNFLAPGIFIYYMVQSKEDLIILAKWLIFLVFIWTGHGLYEYIFKQNYFIDHLIKEFPTYTNSIVTGYHYSDMNRFGSSVRIQGTVWHPISFGGRIDLILCMLLLFRLILDFKRRKTFKLLLNIATLIVFVSVVLTFSRSVWGFYLMTLLLYMYFSSSNGKLKITFLVIIAAIFIGGFYTEIEKVLFNKMGGSSVEMRANQANGVYKLLGDNYVWGRGQQYAASYIAKYGAYTQTFGFESFLFVVILDSGIVGLSFYVVMFGCIIYARSKLKNKAVANAIIYTTIPYLVFIILTGEMQTMWIYWLSINIIFAVDRVINTEFLVVMKDDSQNEDLSLSKS